MGLFFVSLPALQTYDHTDKHLHFQALLPRTYHKELLQTKWFEMFVDAKEESWVIRTAQVVQVKDFIHADRGPHAAGNSFLRPLSVILFPVTVSCSLQC